MRLILSPRPPGAGACGRWFARPVTADRSGAPRGTADHYEESVRLRPGERPEEAFERVRTQLIAYDIFSPRVMRFVMCPAGSVSEGATIVQRFGLGPFALEAAVRVVETWNRHEAARSSAGFAYVTVEGHPERGVATFEVRQDGDHVRVILEARSEAGTFSTRMGRPLARWVQRSLTARAATRLAVT